MILKQQNIFEQTTQLISQDCSSITGQNLTISHNLSQPLHQSIIHLKTVLPTFTSQFFKFKESIMKVSYYIVDRLMNAIRNKNMQIGKLEEDLIKSQELTNCVKKQVIQLKEMISQFMQSYDKQMRIKKIQSAQKQNEINQLKNVLKQNFNSPRNFCQSCNQKINLDLRNPQISNIDSIKQDSHRLQIYDFQNYGNKGQILIQMSQSIICQVNEAAKRVSLQIIQEEGSDINSLTDYLQSRKYSQNTEIQKTTNSIGQLVKSSRSHIIKQIDDEYREDKLSQCYSQKVEIYEPVSLQQLSESRMTQKGSSPLKRVDLAQSPEKYLFRNISSLGNANKNIYNEQINKIQKERRCSGHSLGDNSEYQGFKTVRKPTETNISSNTNTQNICCNIYTQQVVVAVKELNQQISKSSSSSDILHFGDTDKASVNLPKKFENPKNMNFIKENSSKKYSRQQKLKTQPSPRDSKFQLNKENINVQLGSRPIEKCRKIFARKKTIMTHARTNSALGVQQKTYDKFLHKLSGTDQKPYDNTKPSNIGQMQQKLNLIQIRYIQSAQGVQSKSQNSLKPSIATLSSTHSAQQQLLTNKCALNNLTGSDLAGMGHLVVKSHHSVGKCKEIRHSPPRNNICRITSLAHAQKTSLSLNTKTWDRKSTSKSKQKLKVTSKSHLSQQTSFNSQPQKTNPQNNRQKFLTQMNQNPFMTSNANSSTIAKTIKNRNICVHMGGSGNKKHLRKNLTEIKQALMIYKGRIQANSLKQVFYDGKSVNGARQGQGKIIYSNGVVYQGLSKNGKRQGQGKLVLNGVGVYEGQFNHDNIQGQGHLRFLRFIIDSSQCPQILQEASYCGRFINNKFDGMGTLFLNQKQKIVTKFSDGIPYSQLTFYTQNDIQFGHWPTD